MFRAFVLMAITLCAAQLSAQTALHSSIADMRFLDRTTGQIQDFRLTVGEVQIMGQLSVTLNDCRYPAQSVNSDSFAQLTISHVDTKQQYFEGWMVASSPALNALEHTRYDLWVLRCVF